MKVYIAGPMAGIPDHNHPAFAAAAERIRADGHEPINPAENFDGRTDLARKSYARCDIEALLRVDAVAVLPGWTDSLGATLEVAIARELELPVLDLTTLEPTDEVCPLEEARRAVLSERAQKYGHPAENFRVIAQLWTAMFGFGFVASDVALAMAAIKIAREMNQHSMDNLVDIAGYAKAAVMAMREDSEEGEMKEERVCKYKYIEFVKETLRDKTAYWSCVNRESGGAIGFVQWWARWRQYCFFPTSYSVFSADCLRDIADFVEKHKNWREHD